MLSVTMSASVYGIDANIVHVETDISNGLPGIEMVGMLGSEVKEAKERVKIAIKNSGIDFPVKKITINISPADMRKFGTQYDLAIAVGILASEEVIKQESLKDICFLGEMKFNGEISGIKGTLSCVIAAKNAGISKIMVPYDNYGEAIVIKDITIIPVKNFMDVLLYLIKGEKNEYKIEESTECNEENIDFSEVKGQFLAKRAAEITAAGMHNLLLSGPPGAGKTMIARRIPTIMPPLSYNEQIELTRIYSIAGKLNNNGLIKNRPFRDPHHSISKAALIGGGNFPIPGEISYATYGLIFADEFPEFKREVIELLRQPLEERRIVINRLSGSIVYPADFTLVAAMNRCPCGYYPDRKKCKCSASDISRYLSRISQPILDRIDLKVDMPAIKFSEFDSRTHNESSESIRKRVMRARHMQENRYKDIGVLYNSRLSSKQTEYYCEISDNAKLMLKTVFENIEFSARSYYRILKTSRTIADLEGSEKIMDKHVREALMFRLSNLKEN